MTGQRMHPTLRVAAMALVALGGIAGCAAVQDTAVSQDTGQLLRDTGHLLDEDTATDSFDGRYPGFNQFLNRVSSQCDGYPIANSNISALIQSDSNMIDALSRLFEGKISKGDFSAFLGGWYSGTDTTALGHCIFAELPAKPAR
jgi:hypothetical protein